MQHYAPSTLCPVLTYRRLLHHTRYSHTVGCYAMSGTQLPYEATQHSTLPSCPTKSPVLTYTGSVTPRTEAMAHLPTRALRDVRYRLGYAATLSRH
eukprot:1546516-Rhodomonas_salina.1